MELDYGDWVVVDTSRGKEAARVVLAPHQVLASHLQGELKPIQRRLNDADVHRMEQLRRDSSTALKTFGAAVREHKLSMKPISAEYNFDGTQILFSYSAPERVDFRELARELGANLKCRVELRQVGARDEARLLGGLGRCGRTLCCSTWLPMFPEVSMGMAKTQDLALNPSKVSGVCGRLLCCLSYENEQYRQMKAVMPKLGQKATTPRGEGTVVSLQILKNLVTVQLETDNIEATFAATEISYGKSQPTRQEAKRISPESQVDNQATEVSNQSGEAESQTQPQRTGRRRRRRRGRGQSGQTS
jgi:cell fate regulator YaaT (PSP1 superfamily)